ncbi:MAG: RNA polymerase sigma-70 factor [Chitinophagaceae bacterium]
MQELQHQISLGDENAFATLYRLFGKRLLQFATSITRSKEVAEELVEDVFVNIWANRQKISTIDTLTVYLYVAVKNRALTIMSRKAKELVTAPFDFLEPAMDEFMADPYELMITAEMMKRMKVAIDALPPRCKMIFKLVREDGLRYKEVAEILNISINTIDAQMAIAVKKICHALEIGRTRKHFSLETSSKKY